MGSKVGISARSDNYLSFADEEEQVNAKAQGNVSRGKLLSEKESLVGENGLGAELVSRVLPLPPPRTRGRRGKIELKATVTELLDASIE